MGRRKTNFRRRRDDRRNKAREAMVNHKTNQELNKFFSLVMDAVIDDMNERESYRWN